MLKALTSNKDGLTIIEVAIAIVLLATAAISIATIFNMINGLQIDGDRESEAVALAEQKIEELRNDHYVDLSNGSTDFSGELNGFPNGTGTITVSDVGTDLKKVTVEISYDEDDDTNLISLNTVIGALGIAQ